MTETYTPILRRVVATRYITPFREGGSLPALVEADDDGYYVLKFRGAGQGPKVLAAELICGELGRALGLPVPELVYAELDPALGQNEPDEEIKALLDASAGLNLGLDFLPGALAFDPILAVGHDPWLASAIVWFDAFITNVDRTPRNTNMIVWHRRTYLIDHGAALYMHHTWDKYRDRAKSSFGPIRDHVLLRAASELEAVDADLAGRLSRELIAQIVAGVPAEWLGHSNIFADATANRAAYIDYLTERLEPPRRFVEEAINARKRL
jgi:hypothetical protein